MKYWIILLCLVSVVTVGCQNKEKTKNIIDIKVPKSGEVELIEDESISFKEIKVLKKIDTSMIKSLYSLDNEESKYPIEKKYILDDIYENKEIGIEKLEVSFCGYGEHEGYASPIFEISINDIKETVTSDSDLYIISFGEEDKHLEIATEVFRDNVCETHIYSFFKNKFVDMGVMSDNVTKLEDYKWHDGKIYNEYIFNFEEGVVIPKYYVIENNKIVEKYTKYDDVKNNTYTVNDEFLNAMNCKGKLKVGDKIKLLRVNETSENIASIDYMQIISLKVMDEKENIFELNNLPD